MKTYRNLVITLFFLALLNACAPATAGLPASRNAIEVYQASVRLVSGDMPAAGYLRIKNTGAADDRLVGVQADFAKLVMIHKSSVDSNGVARMEMVMAIDLPSGQTVEFKPGGFHIMFDGLKQDVKVGDMVIFTLHFENAGAVRVQAQVTNQ